MPRRRAASATAIVLLATALAPPAMAGARDRRVARGPAPVVVPLFAGELAAPMTAYRAYVRRLLATLQGQTAALVGETATGTLAGAESAWLTAHLTWLRIGQDDGAYGAFGELGRQIDGTAAGLRDGTADPGFTGFHKVELDLWTKDDLAAAAADATELQTRISRLAGRRLGPELPASPAGLSTWTRRTQEILEDGLRDSLSGDDEYGSGTALASVTADVAATSEMLTLLAPVIDPRAPRLVGRARRQLAGVLDAAQATRVGGRWVAVNRLGPPQRERVDAAVGAVLETLAPVPDLLKVAGGS